MKIINVSADINSQTKIAQKHTSPIVENVKTEVHDAVANENKEETTKAPQKNRKAKRLSPKKV